jgi:CDP-glucose 4,6-dehydratase
MKHLLSGKNVLVTGGAGLVGSHLVEKLLELNANIFVLDIVLEPKSYFISKKLEQKAKVLMVDLRNFTKIRQAIAENGIDYIFHLGAQALVPVALEDPLETLNTNVMGTVNVLEAARGLKKVKGILVASSDKAYGKDCVDVTEDQLLNGDHPYDVSKSCVDLVAKMYHRTYGLPVSVARFGNIFGPGDLHFNRIVPGIMQSIIQEKELRIRSNGQSRRDYLFVKDVAEGYIKMAEHIWHTQGEAFNFSTNWNFSVVELVEEISKTLGRPVKYVILNEQNNEILEQSLNWAKAKKVLGWQPIYLFDQGIRDTFEWYEMYLK